MLSLSRVKLKLRANEDQERCQERCPYIGFCLVLAFSFSILVGKYKYLYNGYIWS